MQGMSTNNVVDQGSEDNDGGEQCSEQVWTAKKQTQSVAHESGETSKLEVPKFGEKVEEVHFPMAGVQEIVKEINAEYPVPEEEETYDSCKYAMSTNSLMQESLGNQVSEPEADSDVVASGGKRHRMRSSKIMGVYTPDARVKNLFKSEEKPEYKSIGKANRAQYKKFTELLRENSEQ